MANTRSHENDFLRKAMQGDEVAFMYLYDLWVDKVFMFCYLQVKDHNAAEDICMAVFQNAWSGLPEYRMNSGSFCSWLFSIARVQLAAHTTNPTKRSAQRPQLSPPSVDMAKIAPMMDKLTGLPALCREVLILKLVTGFSTPEICQTLKLTPAETMKIQAQGLMWMSGSQPAEETAFDPRDGARSKLNYLRSRIDVLQAQSYELDDDAFDTHAVKLAKFEARWEDLSERARGLEGAPEARWMELNQSLDEVLMHVGQETSVQRQSVAV